MKGIKKKTITIFVIIFSLFITDYNFQFVEAASDNINEIFSEGEKGPIDLTEETKGVKQITNAGVTDENFAKAIWKSFVKANYSGEESLTIRQILSNYEGEIDGTLSGIKKIDGIEYLRRARAISLDNNFTGIDENVNSIRDLTPLSIDYIRNKYNIDAGSAMRWFVVDLKKSQNVIINITGNPIENYTTLCGGIQLKYSGGRVNVTKLSDMVFIKNNEQSISVSRDYMIPKIYRDGNLVALNQATSDLEMADGAILDKTQLQKYIVTINNINKSQFIDMSYANDPKDNIQYYKTNFIGDGSGFYSSIDSISFRKEVFFYVHVYYPVKPTSRNLTNIHITKYAETIDSETIVAGAKYHLFNSRDNRVNNIDYITDVNGEISISEELNPGKYYLKEVEAPKGYEINEEHLNFEVKGLGSIQVSNGISNPIVTEPSSSQPENNTVYIDRYSDPIVLTVAENGTQLIDIKVSYIDAETQESVTKTFASSKEAETWINNNKGSNASNDSGVFDGLVSIVANFDSTGGELNIKTYDKKEIPKAEFSFKKLDGSNKMPLQGARFALYELNCIDSDHDHDQELISIDEEGNIISENSCWSLNGKANSLSDGTVSFINLPVHKEYRLIEYKAPAGYMNPQGQWIITYDTKNNKFVVNGCVGNPPAFEERTDNHMITLQVKNYQIKDIPVTGFEGIKIYIFSGSTLMILAFILFGKKLLKGAGVDK